MKALYKQVSDQILEQISSGGLKVGDRLPPEADFADELGVSRSTLRLAFNQLESGGVLRRRQRSGTEIIAAEPLPNLAITKSSMQDMLKTGRETRFHIESTSMVDKDNSPLLHEHLSESEQWLKVFGWRTIDNDAMPIGTNCIYVPARFSGVRSVLGTSGASVFQSIENEFDVSLGRVTKSISAIACPSHSASIMGLDTGAPVLKIDAVLYIQTGELMEVSVALFDPVRFQVTSDIKVKSM